MILVIDVRTEAELNQLVSLMHSHKIRTLNEYTIGDHIRLYLNKEYNRESMISEASSVKDLSFNEVIRVNQLHHYL